MRGPNCLAVIVVAIGTLLAGQASGATLSKAAIESDAARQLFDRCDQIHPSGTLDDVEIYGYVVSLNEALFEKFDVNCSGSLEGAELEAYYANERAEAEKRLNKAKASVDRRIEETVRDHRTVPVTYAQASDISADAELAKFSIGLSYSDSHKPTENEYKTDLSFSAEQKPWRTFRGAVPLSIGLDWGGELSRDVLHTDEKRTRTDEFAFTPFSFKSTDADERLEFKLSVGPGLVKSEELDIATGVTESKRNATVAYKVGVTYAMGKGKCWKVGAVYEVKNKHPFSGTVSSAFGPVIEYDLLCDDEAEDSSLPRLTPRGVLQTR